MPWFNKVRPVEHNGPGSRLLSLYPVFQCFGALCGCLPFQNALSPASQLKYKKKSLMFLYSVAVWVCSAAVMVYSFKPTEVERKMDYMINEKKSSTYLASGFAISAFWYTGGCISVLSLVFKGRRYEAAFASHSSLNPEGLTPLLSVTILCGVYFLDVLGCTFFQMINPSATSLVHAILIPLLQLISSQLINFPFCLFISILLGYKHVLQELQQELELTFRGSRKFLLNRVYEKRKNFKTIVFAVNGLFEVFWIPILAYICCFAITLCMGFFMLFNLVENNAKAAYIGLLASVNISVYSSIFIFGCSVCDNIKKQTHRISQLVIEAYEDAVTLKDRDVKTEMKIWWMEIHGYCIDTSIGGYVTIGNQLCLSMIVGVISFVAILLQFQDAEETNNLSNNNYTNY